MSRRRRAKRARRHETREDERYRESLALPKDSVRAGTPYFSHQLPIRQQPQRLDLSYASNPLIDRGAGSYPSTASPTLHPHLQPDARNIVGVCPRYSKRSRDRCGPPKWVFVVWRNLGGERPPTPSIWPRTSRRWWRPAYAPCPQK
jgi:hypothetical protein